MIGRMYATAHFNSRPSARGDRSGQSRVHGFFIFQFTPLREGRRFFRDFVDDLIDFNSRPSARGDKPPSRPADIERYFNSRPSARGDGVRLACVVAGVFISIHAPPRGATPPPLTRKPPAPHFNSRPSARGDLPNAQEVSSTHISIHAPPRGATDISRHGKTGRGISIHAPPRGATRYTVREAYTARFQFTPLREGRRPCGC